jgi:hypothetical protein
VYENAFMVKGEGNFHDWYSSYDNAWILKLKESNFNVNKLGELLKETGIVATTRYTRFQQHGRYTRADVFETGMLKYSGDYNNDSSGWRRALREALGGAVELLSAAEAISRVSCKLEPVGVEQQGLLDILNASCLLALRMANCDVLGAVGEEEV